MGRPSSRPNRQNWWGAVHYRRRIPRTPIARHPEGSGPAARGPSHRPSRHHPLLGTAHASTLHAADRPAPRRPRRQPGRRALAQAGVEGLHRRRRQRHRGRSIAWTNGTGRLTADVKGLKANTAYHIVLRKGSCSNPKTVLGKLGSFVTDRLGRGLGREGDHQQPDGLGLVGAVRARSRPASSPAAASSAPRSGTTTRPASGSLATTSTCPS